MINYIKGVVKDLSSNKLIIECNNFGYEVNVINEKVYKIDQEVFLYTVLIVKEDEFILVGFENKDLKEVFILLNKITGIGTKISLNLLRTYSLDALCNIIENEDVNSLKRVSGITGSLALQIIVALKLKIKKYSKSEPNLNYQNDLFVYKALEGLSYNKQSIEDALRKCKNHDNANILLKEALSILGKSKSYG